MKLKKLEIWLTDRTDSDYTYAYIRDEGKRMNSDTAQKALEFLISQKDMDPETPLQVDFIGGEPVKEYTLIQRLQEFRENFESKSGRKLNFRLIDTGYMEISQNQFLREKNISIRNSLTSMEPTDAWWYKVRSGSDVPVSGMTEKIPIIKQIFSHFQQRLVISHEKPEIKARVEKLLSDGTGDIQLIPELTTVCRSSDADDLEASMKEFSLWFKKELLNHNILPVVNAKQMLFLIHCFNEGEPYPVKNQCNNTHERVMLDVDGTFRPCRHFHLYPKWTLGNIDEGFYHSRRLSLNRYGLVMKNGCNKCAARFFCAGPCLSASAIYTENYIRPLGYHCLFTTLLTEMMEYVYNTLIMENPEVLEWTLKTIGNPMGR